MSMSMSEAEEYIWTRYGRFGSPKRLASLAEVIEQVKANPAKPTIIVVVAHSFNLCQYLMREVLEELPDNIKLFQSRRLIESGNTRILFCTPQLEQLAGLRIEHYYMSY